MHDLATLRGDPHHGAGRSTNDGVQAPVAATTASASISSLPASTPAARPARHTSTASPDRIMAPFRHAALIRASRKFRPSTRAAPGMYSAGMCGRNGGNRRWTAYR